MNLNRFGLALLFLLCVNWTHGELRDVVIMQTTDMHGDQAKARALITRISNN